MGAPREPTVHPQAFEGLLEVAARLGGHVPSLLREAGLPHGTQGHRQPRAHFLALKAALSRQLQDPDLGFRLGELVPLEALGLYGPVSTQTPTVREAVERGISLIGVWEEGTRIHLEVGRSHAALHYENVTPRSLGQRIDDEQSIVMLALKLRAVAGPAVPMTAAFASARPGARALSLFARHHLTPRFEAPGNHVHFPAALLEQPMPPWPKAVVQLSAAEMERELARAQGTLESRLSALLRTHLAAGWSQSDYARALGVSTRSLQVQLQEQGTRYSALLKAARLERAEALLATQSVKATARDLGFTSVAAFSRFFRTAKGRTPSGR